MIIQRYIYFIKNINFYFETYIIGIKFI